MKQQRQELYLPSLKQMRSQSSTSQTQYISPHIPPPFIMPSFEDTRTNIQSISFSNIYPLRSNTPESDLNSIISNHSHNSLNTEHSKSPFNNNITFSNANHTSMKIESNINIKLEQKTYSDDDYDYGLPPKLEMESEPDDDEEYIPPTTNPKKCGKKCVKKRKKSKRKKKIKKESNCQQINKNTHRHKVCPSLDGRESIPWSELTECKLECHLCDEVFTELNGGRLEYIEHLKNHYNDKSNDLVYLECELCLKNPTKNNLRKKEQHIADGTALTQPNLWRTSSHVANFISHIAGHSKQAGFLCNVKVWSEGKQKYVRCGATGSTQQNLAKHVYGAHYKYFDENEEYTVDPVYGYCLKSNIPKKSKKKAKNSPKSKKKKRKRKESDDDDEYLPEPIAKKRKLPKRAAKKTTKKKIIKNESKNLMIPSSIGHQYFSLIQQQQFGQMMVYAAAPKLYELANIACGNSTN